MRLTAMPTSEVMTMTPIEASFELIAQLEQGTELTEDLRQWLLLAFRKCCRGHAKTIDEGLGLAVGQGESARKLSNVWRKSERNRLILELGHLLDLPRMKQAKVIHLAMTEGIMDVEGRDAALNLIRLRNLCLGTKLVISESRVREILAGASFASTIKPVFYQQST